MNNPICISTGTLYKVSQDKNEMIERLREFSPDGIEISFSRPDSLSAFKISDRSLEYLRGLRLNSIHSPWEDVIYGHGGESRRVLREIKVLYTQIGARNVVFHKGILDNLKVLEEYDFTASVENDDWRKSANKTPEQLERILGTNPYLRFTFDFAHALTTSPDDIPRYIERFNGKLIEVHMSRSARDAESHSFLHREDSEKMRYLLAHLKKTNAPFVLECVVPTLDEVHLLGKEMEYLRSL